MWGGSTQDYAGRNDSNVGRINSGLCGADRLSGGSTGFHMSICLFFFVCVSRYFFILEFDRNSESLRSKSYTREFGMPKEKLTHDSN